MADFKIKRFPKSRIATNDVCAIGLKRHHIVALIEVDVSESWQKIKQYKKEGNKVSFTAWLVKMISNSIRDYENVAAYLQGKRTPIIFNDINISMAVEKDLNGQKVPMPLIIEKTNERSIESIQEEIDEAKNQNLTGKDIVLHRKSNKLERFYYILPGSIRRLFWRYLISHPHFAYGKMGNVAITSVGMMGRADGWFIPISVHPICFGIGRISKKPIVVNDKIEIREMLKMTVLLDHDVVDGGQMIRFISSLTGNIEKGWTPDP
ncbi:2-oxo acid dehydrogenase subunit E2 [Negadavirga shengliensis]|uniref:2-oxo acid dehydrogenase subunit E2 n=1 Tax=Negadavirga shengliensis TaxID=1389218 RepID=A0ABV9T7I6_9BACT